MKLPASNLFIITDQFPFSPLSQSFLKKILYNQISQFMDKNATICSNQFDFRKNHSTQQAIITLIILFVMYNGAKSDLTSVKCDVPQADLLTCT